MEINIKCYYNWYDVTKIIPEIKRILYMLLLLLLLKNIGNARPGEGDWHPISPKTPAPHYQPIKEKKRKGKYVEDKKGESN